MKATSELKAFLSLMVDRMAAIGHRTVHSTAEGHIIFISFSKERIAKASKALSDADCLCETSLGTYGSFLALKDEDVVKCD